MLMKGLQDTIWIRLFVQSVSGAGHCDSSATLPNVLTAPLRHNIMASTHHDLAGKGEREYRTTLNYFYLYQVIYQVIYHLVYQAIFY